tara:strand:- start:2387 stop:2788 length:402 start_codon:yes stop_codon:yes gene_type:complete
MAQVKINRGVKVLPDHKTKIALSISEEKNSYGYFEYALQTTEVKDPWNDGFNHDTSNPKLAELGGARSCKSAVGPKDNLKDVVKQLNAKYADHRGVIPFKHSQAVVKMIEKIDNKYRGTKDGSPIWNPKWSKK